MTEVPRHEHCRCAGNNIWNQPCTSEEVYLPGYISERKSFFNRVLQYYELATARNPQDRYSLLQELLTRSDRMPFIISTSASALPSAGPISVNGLRLLVVETPPGVGWIFSLRSFSCSLERSGRIFFGSAGLKAVVLKLAITLRDSGIAGRVANTDAREFRDWRTMRLGA